MSQDTMQRLPNGDLWRPAGSPTTNVEPAEKHYRRGEEKVKAAIAGGLECPWCGHSFETKPQLKGHIEKLHFSKTLDDQDEQAEALKAAATKAASATKAKAKA